MNFDETSPPRQRLRDRERKWMRLELDKATLACPSCSSSISTRASSCPRCGVPLTAEMWITSLRKRFRRNLKAGGWLLGGIAVVGFVALSPEPGLGVSASDYGSQWPFPEFESARVYCERFANPGGSDIAAVFVQMGGARYALNGTAVTTSDLPSAYLMVEREQGTEDSSADGRGLISPDAAAGVQTMIREGQSLCQGS
jgi:hypothetical protein